MIITKSYEDQSTFISQPNLHHGGRLNVVENGLQYLAGAFAGFSINVFVYPLDTLKTRLQSPSYIQVYRSPVAIAHRTLYRGLYQGLGSVLLVAIPSSGVFFTTYESLKYALRASSLPQPAIHAISGSVAQILNCVIVTPAEVIKQNAQVLNHDHKTRNGHRRVSATLETIKQLKKHPLQLWRGYTALAVRDIPFTALQFPALEYLKKKLTGRHLARLKEGEVVTLSLFERTRISTISAAIAGSTAAWVTTPADVVKTRMMLEVGQKTYNVRPGAASIIRHQDGSLFARKGGFQIGREVFRNQGIRGLFRGALIRTVWTAFGNGLFIGCYEGAKIFLDN